MLNEFGFVRKTYADLLESMEDHAKSLFGEDVRTSANSVLGILIRIVAWALSLIYELIEKVYFSSFINSATGVSLDRLASNNGIYRNPAAAAVVELTFTGEPGYVIEEGVQFATEKMMLFQMIDEVTLDADGNGVGQAVSIEYSAATNVLADTITLLVEPVEELYTVNNEAAASGGADLEDDTSFRSRIKLSTRANPGPPLNGIYTAIYALSGVRTVNIIENNTNAADSMGNPPKSLHIFVAGGNSKDIANAIFENVAAGIETVGEEQQTVEDVAGFDHSISFDFAEKLPIFVQIDLQTNASFEDDGVEQIKDLIMSYVANVEMGTTVFYSYIYPIIYKVTGVEVATVKIGTSADNLSATDIPLQPREITEIKAENVQVSVHE